MSLLEISIRIGNIITSFINVLQGGSFHQWLFIQNSAASMQMVLMQPLSLLHFPIFFSARSHDRRKLLDTRSPV